MATWVGGVCQWELSRWRGRESHMDWLVRDGELDNAEKGILHLHQHVQRQSSKEKLAGLG